MGKKDKKKLNTPPQESTTASGTEGGNKIQDLSSVLTEALEQRSFLFQGNNEALIELEDAEPSVESIAHYAESRLFDVLKLVEEPSSIDLMHYDQIVQRRVDFVFILRVHNAVSEYLGKVASIYDITQLIQDRSFLLSSREIFAQLAFAEVEQLIAYYPKKIDLKDIKNFCSGSPTLAMEVYRMLGAKRNLQTTAGVSEQSLPNMLAKMLRSIKDEPSNPIDSLEDLKAPEAVNRIRTWKLLESEKSGEYTGLTRLSSSGLSYLAAMTSTADELGPAVLTKTLPKTPQKEAVFKVANNAIKSLQRGAPDIASIEASTGSIDAFALLSRLDKSTAMGFVRNLWGILYDEGDEVYSIEMKDSARAVLVLIGEEMLGVRADVEDDLTDILVDMLTITDETDSSIIATGMDNPKGKGNRNSTELVLTTDGTEEEDTIIEQERSLFRSFRSNNERIIWATIRILSNPEPWDEMEEDFFYQTIRRLIWEYAVDPALYQSRIQYGPDIYGYGDISDPEKYADPGMIIRHLVSMYQGVSSIPNMSIKPRGKGKYTFKSMPQYLDQLLRGLPRETLLQSPFVSESTVEDPLIAKLCEMSSQYILISTLMEIRRLYKGSLQSEREPLTPYPISLAELILSDIRGKSILDLAREIDSINNTFEKILKERIGTTGVTLDSRRKVRSFVVEQMVYGQKVQLLNPDLLKSIAEEVSKSLDYPMDLSEEQVESLRSYMLRSIVSDNDYILTPSSQSEKELLWYLLGGKDVSVRGFSTIDLQEFWNYENFQEEAIRIATPGEDPDMLTRMLFIRFVRFFNEIYSSGNRRPERFEDIIYGLVVGMSLGGTPAFHEIQGRALSTIYQRGETYSVGRNQMDSVLDFYKRRNRRETPVGPINENLAQTGNQIEELTNEVSEYSSIAGTLAFLRDIIDKARSPDFTVARLSQRSIERLESEMRFLLPGFSKRTLLNSSIILLFSAEGREALDEWVKFEESRSEALFDSRYVAEDAEKASRFLEALANGNYHLESESEAEIITKEEVEDTTESDRDYPSDMIERISKLSKRVEIFLENLEEHPDLIELGSLYYENLDQLRRFLIDTRELIETEKKVKENLSRYARPRSNSVLFDDSLIDSWIKLLSQLNVNDIASKGLLPTVDEIIGITREKDVEGFTQRIQSNYLFWTIREVEKRLGRARLEKLLGTLINQPKYDDENILLIQLLINNRRPIDLSNPNSVKPAVSELLERLQFLAKVTEKLEEVTETVKEEAAPLEVVEPSTKEITATGKKKKGGKSRGNEGQMSDEKGGKRAVSIKQIEGRTGQESRRSKNRGLRGTAYNEDGGSDIPEDVYY